MDKKFFIDEELVSLDVFSVSEIKKPKEGLSEVIVKEIPENKTEIVSENSNAEPKEPVGIKSDAPAAEKQTEKHDHSEYEKKQEPPQRHKPAMLQGKSETIEITGDNFVIGKDEDCDYVLDKRYISREHCKITIYEGRYFIEDLDSTNGTKVDGKKIHSKTELFNNQVVTLADRRYTFWAD